MLSVAALLAPLHLAGRFDPSVTWDLAFANAGRHLDRDRVRILHTNPAGSDPPRDVDPPIGADCQRPCVAFSSDWAASTGGVRSRLAFERRITDAATASTGPRSSTRRTPVVGGEGSAAVRLTLLVIDDDGRDLHELTSEVAASDADAAAERLQDLLERAYWIPAR